MKTTTLARKKAFIIAMAAISIAAFLILMLYLFRVHRIDNPEIGVLEYRAHWGAFVELEADTNRDGSVDFRARYSRAAHPLETGAAPLEYWEDSNHDGNFEIHVILVQGAISRIEVDTDEDGIFEKKLEGEAAKAFYRDRKPRSLE